MFSYKIYIILNKKLILYNYAYHISTVTSS